MNPPCALFDPARHEPLAVATWDEAAARAAIARIVDAAEREFDEAGGHWPMHPRDEPLVPGAPSYNLYWGASGTVWALLQLQAAGRVRLRRDYAAWIPQYPARVHEEAATEQHGSASYLFGETGPLLLAWRHTRSPAFADRIHTLVRDNLHNPAHEPLWGNAGTVLAAIGMAESCRDARWPHLVRDAVQALLDDMVIDPGTGTWTWKQHLYGHRSHHLGAGHGLAGNAYAALRGAAFADAATVQTVLARCLQTLVSTAVAGRVDGVELVGWHPESDRHGVARRMSLGRLPLVQDCHGAPGIVCRLAQAPRTPAWDALLLGAAELTWHAGPLAKGASLCHGTAGNAVACLKLWRRSGQPHWLERARLMALHAAAQVEAERQRHGQGRHGLWTGDLGVACVLAQAISGGDAFPSLDPT